VYVDYALPERHLGLLQVGQPVQVRVSAHPDRTFDGSIQVISPGIDQGTRNVRVRAGLSNPDLALRPGMFARVATLLPREDAVLTIPREAIAFNTYGDAVFVIREEDGKTLVERRQVRTGAVRGEEIAVLEGLAEGERVVLAGQVKLATGKRSGSSMRGTRRPRPVHPSSSPRLNPSRPNPNGFRGRGDMKFTDIFVHRPVLATVVSLLIFILGIRAFMDLEIRQYPATQNTVVTITTAYPGASSDLVQGFITTPLQQAIAEANGIEYLVGTSTAGLSVIEANMRLNYDPNAAVAEIQAKVASRLNVLPEAAQNPVIDSTTGDSTALMYLAFYSEEMTLPQITDYLIRVVQPQLQALEGIAKAEIFGDQTFAMRIWLDPARMASLGVSGDEVARVLAENNYLAGIGRLRGDQVQIDLSATTDVSRVEDFQRLVVRTQDDTLIRLDDIAEVEMGAKTYDSATLYKGIPAIFIGIEPAPGSNPLDVAARVRDLMPELETQFPEGLKAFVPYDASEFIEDSITEVFKTLAEAVLIVLLVIFLSLGSIRAALVPSVAVPLSIVGAGFLMLLLGFSINLLTLLAMVLAIGLVVDDAIIVVENVHRHIEMGKSGTQAAIDGARELAMPIIAMTTTLVAVYAPIGFMGGLVGSLFTEFAFTLAGAVVVSGVVALTLSPMLAGRVLRAGQRARPFRARRRACSSPACRGLSALAAWLAQVSGRHPRGRRRHPGRHLRDVQR
jgi:multidrug efflux pump subunit AcrB